MFLNQIYSIYESIYGKARNVGPHVLTVWSLNRLRNSRIIRHTQTTFKMELQDIGMAHAKNMYKIIVCGIPANAGFDLEHQDQIAGFDLVHIFTPAVGYLISNTIIIIFNC